jgi:hypothetical protein
MTNTINQLVNQINQTEKEIAVMDQKIHAIEMEKLNGIIAVAKEALIFNPIYENAFGQDEEYYDEEEYFTNDDGDFLNGTLVYFLVESYEEIEDANREICIEIFLLEDGSLKIFHTLTESQYCEDCEMTHGHSHRIIAEDQSLEGYDIWDISDNIEFELKSRASSLEDRKNERIAKLENLMIAQ